MLKQNLSPAKPSYLKFIKLIGEYRDKALGKIGGVLIPMREVKKIKGLELELTTHIYQLIRDGVLEYLTDLDFLILGIKKKKTEENISYEIIKKDRKEQLAISYKKTWEEMKEYYRGLRTTEKPEDFDDHRTKLFISAKYGIYLDPETRRPAYAISGKRAKLLQCLLKLGASTGPELANKFYRTKENLPLLSQEISKINKAFRKILDLSEDLIIRVSTGGYELNREKYNIDL